ncbi:MAG: hypothetical protein MJ196_04865 [Treponemataceae bacterium]|nr:hypothetical protein [Treponemataceae bacterium]
MYSYLTLNDGTEVVHSKIIEKNGIKTVQVHFECPVEGGFKSARCELPSYSWLFNEGYSDEEIKFFTEFLEHNAHLLFEFASEGGMKIA